MKILLITDIHYGQNTNNPKHGDAEYVNSFGEDFCKYLTNLSNAIKKHDMVVCLGDLIHVESREADMEKFRECMSLLEVGKPVRCVMGNHDIRFLSREILANFIHESKIYYSFDDGGYHHIVLDGNKRGEGDLIDSLPCVDDEQIEWLKNDLNQTKLQTLVYIHYPLDNQDITDNYYFKERSDRAFVQNKNEVRGILENSGKVLAVFGGHLHFFNQLQLNGIIHVTAPSFTENDGNNNPKAEFLSVEVTEESGVKIEIVKLEADTAK